MASAMHFFVAYFLSP